MIRIRTLRCSCICIRHSFLPSSGAFICPVPRLLRDQLTILYRHYYPGATERFPALKELPHLNPWKALLLSSLICMDSSNHRFPMTLLMLRPFRLGLAIAVLEGKRCLIGQISPRANLVYMYIQFVYVSRRAKIESGERTTSLSFLLNNKRGLIGRALAAIKPEYRPESFMAGQFGEHKHSISQRILPF